MTEMAGSGETPLPAEIVLNDESSYDVWAVWVATGRRFLPSQILSEPEALLTDIVTLDSLYHAIKERADGNKNS